MNAVSMTVSPEAVNALKKAAEERRAENAPEAVRVYVRGQCGCGAAHFGMGFDDPEEGDRRIDLDGVTLLVDEDAALFLDNAQMDYVDDPFHGGFRIKSTAGGCGCGGH